jgi:hypothetical protein
MMTGPLRCLAAFAALFAAAVVQAAPAVFVGEQARDGAGSAVAFAGDFNGDGVGDYVVGIPGYDIPATAGAKVIRDAGRAVVVSGKDASVLAAINGVRANDAGGFAVAGNADINGDGYSDVLVGAPRADAPDGHLRNAGSTSVIFGPDGVVREVFYGATAGALSGSALALGDVDDDGHADIVLGAPKDENPAKELKDVGSVTVLSGDGYGQLARYHGAVAGAQAGASVAVGDFDGDGVGDVAYGVPYEEGFTYGWDGIPLAVASSMAGVMCGCGTNVDFDVSLPRAGMVHVNKGNGDALFYIQGAQENARLGKVLALADTDGNGSAELLLVAPGERDSHGVVKGSLNVIGHGDSEYRFRVFGTGLPSGKGTQLTAGDVDGDGHADIIMAASKADVRSRAGVMPDAGKVFVYSASDFSLAYTLSGERARDNFGASVSAGDTNGDGLAELLIGIPGFDASPVPPANRLVKDAGAVERLDGTSL